MKHLLVLLAVCAACASVAGETVRRIERLRPLHTETALVSKGRATAIVAAAKADAALAGRLIGRVKALTGVELPLVDDGKVTEDDFRRANVIVIGNFMANKVAERLYVQRFTYEDYVYPGIAGTKGDGGPPVTGYVIRTVHDPFALGRNFIVLAGSEPAGTAEAVQRFAESLSGKDPLVVPHTVKVRFGAMQRMEPAYTKNDLPQANVDKMIGQIRRTVTNMKSLHNNIWFQSEGYALGYQLTGNPCWAKVVKGQLEILAENLDRFNALPNNYVEGMFGLVPAWDWMEETPFFTDAERLKFTNAVLEVACRNEAAWTKYLRNPRAEALSSHGGDRVQSWRHAGYYFSQHYRINHHWLDVTAEAVHFMNTTPRSCDGYHLGCGHGTRLTHYARRTGDMGYVANYFRRIGDVTYAVSPSLRQQADLVMMCTDNQGYVVTVGDHDRWNSRVDREWNLARFMAEAAWFYKDSSYLWFAQHLAYHELPFGAFATGETPKRPDRLVGLNVLPVHKNIYENVQKDEPTTARTFELAPPLTVPCEQAFDKLTFREAVDPTKQYLLLDGVSGMDHGHIDGNSIVRFSDLERMWLVDVGWTRCYPRDHNMLLVVKDGESKGPQKFTRLDAACDLGAVVLTKTTIPGYSGMDWSRHLVWLKGEGVVALDRVAAQAAGDYTLRCRWRCPGEAKLTENGLLVTQGGPRFHILNADGSQQRLRSLFLDDTNHSLRTYPHANARGETIVYDNVVERRFAVGESYTFQNLFFAASDKVRREYSLERVDDSTVRVTSPRGAIVVGVLKGDALFMLTGARFSLAQGTALGDPPLFRADKPVDVEYDAATGQGTVIAKTPARLTLLAASADGKLDGAPVKGDFRDGMVSLQIAPGRHVLALAPSPEAATRMAAFAAAFAPKPLKRPAPTREPLQGLTMEWETRIADTEAEILDMTLGDLGSGKTEIVTAGKDGTVAVIGLDGKVRWRQTGLVRADSVAIARFDNKPHVVAGCHKPPYLYVFTAGGARLEGDWAKVDASDPFKGLAAPLRYVAAADMDGDGSDEVLAANFPNTEKAVMGCCYCFDKMGRMKWWRQPVNHELATATVAPLKRDGPLAFLVGGTFNSCAGLNASGAECFSAFASHRLTVIRAADVDGDKTNEVLIAGQDNYVHLHDADGKRRWMHNVGGAVSGLAVADVNGDGKPEIIATTAELNYNVLALTADGKRLWQAKAGEEVNALAVGNVTGRGRPDIVVGTDGGEVLVLDGAGKKVVGAALSSAVAKLSLCPAGTPGRQDVLVGLKDGQVRRLGVAR